MIDSIALSFCHCRYSFIDTDKKVGHIFIVIYTCHFVAANLDYVQNK